VDQQLGGGPFSPVRERLSVGKFSKKATGGEEDFGRAVPTDGRDKHRIGMGAVKRNMTKMRKEASRKGVKGGDESGWLFAVSGKKVEEETSLEGKKA